MPLPVTLQPEDKLEIVRRVDCFHPWKSLDEKRQCRRCGAIFTGAQIEICRGPGAGARARLQCPTEGCCSVPIEWMMLSGDPPDPGLAANAASRESESRTAAAAVAHTQSWRYELVFGFLRLPQSLW
ncbi:MAG: hypothetical protein M3480_09435 [Verrucomicrobiota bacterium]|nr:hypothetical protein [Chthoniobacterales bacterium]MDQ3415172.1 hypothetical protein [Verrucomicrobiota bacterium]